MKLYLCGGGSSEQIIFALLSFSNNLDKSKPILYIPLAMNESRYESCYNWFKEELKYIGLSKFEMIRLSEELSLKNLYNYSAIFIGGGNTYKLLYELKQNNNFEKIESYLKNNGIVFGGSAGAIIFGKDINTCLLDDGNIVDLKDTKGFNLLNNYSILCHLNNKNLKRNKKYLQNYSINEKVIYLPEEDVILVEDNKISIIGNKKYMIFKNGKFEYHNFANFKKDIVDV